MFTRNRKIQSLILLICAAALTAHPLVSTAQAQGQPPARQSASVQVPNFDNLDIYEFVNQMSRLLNLNPIMIDPLVQGNANLIAQSVTMPRENVFDLFNQVLKNNGAMLTRLQGVYHVIPIASAMRNGGIEIVTQVPEPAEQEGGPSTEFLPARPAQQQERVPEDAKTPRVATYVIPVDFVPVRDLLGIIDLFITPGTVVSYYERMNMLIVTDYSENAARIQELVRILDNSFLDPNLVELIKVEYNNAEDIVVDLKKVFELGTGGGGMGNAAAGNAAAGTGSTATGVSFLPLERLNAILVVAASKRGLDEARRWIRELDSSENSKFQNYVYVVQDSTASNIAMLLSALYGDDGSGSSSTASGTRNTQGTTGSSTRSNSANSLINQALSGDGAFGSATQLGPRLNAPQSTVTSIILGSGEFSSLRDVARVVVDDINNVLYIAATPADYRFLLSAIEKMDTPPRQMYIDVEILEARLTKNLDYGFSGLLKERTEGNLTTADISETGSLLFETFAGVGKSRQIMLTLQALKAQTKVKTLENPTLLATDGINASFISGADVPFPSGTIIGNSLGTTTIDYRPTGVTLLVLPKISASGSVTMQITQEVSTASFQNVGDTTAPIFPKTTLETVLTVKDGETVAIAGLIHDESDWLRGGIPFLSDIPFIGGLFGGTKNGNSRTELIVLITPRVIPTQEKFQELSQRLRDSLSNVRRLADEYEAERIKDIEGARKDREKQELSDIRKVKPPKKEKGK